MATPLWALEHGWISSGNAQVLILEDPAVDFALRVAAVDRSQHSIHSIAYLQGADRWIGMPMLQAFRRAAARGVRGQYLMTRLGSMFEDSNHLTEAMLTDETLASPAEVIRFGNALSALLKGLNLTDFVHEKILILDAGTPNETIFIGGRNNSRFSLHNVDLALVVRRIDATKPGFGDQALTAFYDTWDAARRVERVARSSFVNPRLLPDPSADAEIELNPQQKADFAQMNALLAAPPDPSAPMLAFESRPEKVRVLNNDFLSYALTRAFGRSYKRRETLTSDIVDAMVREVVRAKKIYITTMFVFLPKTLKEALKTALRNGAEVHLMTNSQQTQKTHVPWGLAYLGSLTDILELMEVGGNLSVYVLDENLLRAHEDLYPLVTYVHRKLAVVDDHVFTGSDNFSDNSRNRNTEIVLQAEDARLASQLRDLMASDLKVFRRLSCEQALADYRSFGLIQRGLNRIFYPIY